LFLLRTASAFSLANASFAARSSGNGFFSAWTDIVLLYTIENKFLNFYPIKKINKNIQQKISEIKISKYLKVAPKSRKLPKGEK
jgi:hypothetical protein